MNKSILSILVCLTGLQACIDYESRGISPEYELFHQGKDAESRIDDEPPGVNEPPVQVPGGVCETMYKESVQAFLEKKCVMCHGDPPAGAPNSLVTYDDLLSASPSGQLQYVRVHARVSSDTMPPEGFELATAEEKQLLEEWLTVCDEETEESKETDGQSPVDNDVEDAQSGQSADIGITQDASSGEEEQPEDASQEETSDIGDSGVESSEECIPDPDGPDWEHDIKPLFESQCTSCHGDPLYAPFPLLSYEDVVSASPLGPPVYERSFFLMTQQTMPPGGGNTEEQNKLVSDWIANCVLENRDSLSVEEGSENDETDTEENDETDTEVSDEDAVEYTTWSDLLPLLEADCGGCHFGGYAPYFSYEYAAGGVEGSGDPTCSDLTVAECMIKYIEEETMPPPGSRNKVQNATVPALESWIDGGYLK